MHPSSYRGCWHEVSRCLFLGYRHRTGISSRPYSSPRKGVYNPKAVIPHAVSLRQTFVHCERFPTAASRRSLGRISVPMWLIVLSDQLPIIALVGFYPTNKLIGRGPILRRHHIQRAPFIILPYDKTRLCGITPSFLGLSPIQGQVTHVLLTRSPLYSPSEEGFLVRLA